MDNKSPYFKASVSLYKVGGINKREKVSVSILAKVPGVHEAKAPVGPSTRC